MRKLIVDPLEKKSEWVPFTRSVIRFGEDMHGDIVTREVVGTSYKNLVGTAINYRHDLASVPVGTIDKVWEDPCGITVEGRVREDLKKRGEFGCGGRVTRDENGKMVEWKLEEVSWIMSPRECVEDLLKKGRKAEKVAEVAHMLRSLESPGEGAAVPEDLGRRIRDARHELDVVIVEWGEGRQ